MLECTLDCDAHLTRASRSNTGTCWLQLHRVLQHYYAELVMNLSPCRRAVDGEKWSKRPEEGDNLRIDGNDRHNLLSTMPYHAFLREFYLLAIVHTLHYLAQLKRWGRFSGKGAAALILKAREPWFAEAAEAAAE